MSDFPTFETLLYDEPRKHVARIRLNRPDKRNAQNMQMTYELNEAFDFAVNSGIQTAIRKLQAVLGVADDGHFGVISRRALASSPVSDVLLRYVAARLDFLARLSTWPTFGRGWARRIANDLRYAAEVNEV